ncbi:MAG: ribosomal protein S18-alanine N-acetyltransferase [Mogibacterium sp.]|nr:ribosomal protein S18-alanine N-acetyltransferase [Mogibacterium sp.]
MDEPLILRPAVPADARAIARLEEICFPIPWSEASILHDLCENDLAVVIVAEYEGTFAGYADVWCVAGEGQLNNIAVLPALRGRKIGRKLMDFMMMTLLDAGCAEMTLEVRSGNLPAIRLYKSLGFETVGRREKYYLDNGEDALLMRRTL